MEDWIKHASAWISGNGQDAQHCTNRGIRKIELKGAMRGVFTYGVSTIEGESKRLLVNHFIAMDILYDDEVTDRLMANIDALVHENECDGVDIQLGSVR